MSSGPSFAVDAGYPADRVRMGAYLDAWYREIAGLGGIPAPGAPLALSAELRTAYATRVAAVIAKVAALSGASEFELYWANRGRIPPWAWPEPHQRVRGIATPVPAGLRQDPATGAVSMLVSGVSVTYLPDELDDTMSGRAETRSLWQLVPCGYRYTVEDGTEVVIEITPPPSVEVTIQTFFCRDLGPGDPVAYGRGYTPEDVAGAKVHPWSGTVAFHEGLHGMDHIDYLRTRTPPAFGGRAGMTVPQVEAAGQRWVEEWEAYQKRLSAASHARTDDVGLTTYSQYHSVNPAARPDVRPVIYVTPHRPPAQGTPPARQPAVSPPARQPAAAPAAGRDGRPVISVTPHRPRA